VHVIELGHCQEGFPAEKLEATAGIRRRIAEQTGTHGVGDP